jgi:hypothetical protein
MMNPLLLEVILKEKRRELLEEADRQRLVAIYNADNPGWRARFQIALGDALIRLGEKIKHRSTRPFAIDNDLCRE